ncbi:MAG: hypothetical protein IBX64_07550 [Actinobacteria bacterium]|nr:hypothetical protein [Actinomycetota bacterium]
MKRLMGLIKNGVAQLQRNLDRGGKKQLLNNQLNDLQTHIDSADHLLMKEYESLVEALEKEKDPIKRYRIMVGVVELEIVLEKRRMLMEYSES